VKIGEAARTIGVSERSLRFYEDQGLIVPGRCSNGYRDYCRSTIDRVLLIRTLLESGLPVRLIRRLLPDVADASSHLGAELACPEILAEVRRLRDRLDQHIADLDARRSALDLFLGQARGGGRW
jgi:DNA-binding transcriptional MerR regulator